MSDLRIILQNENFVAVDKPAGMLSVPGRTQDDPRPILGRLLEQQLGRAIFPIHRLDAEVSGLVLYALTPEAHREANRQFEERHVQKTYQAFSKGGDFSEGKRGEWRAHILRGKKRAYESPAGKISITGYEVVGLTDQSYFEWRLYPKTGRSHQLRWELFRHGSPIVGDTLYGSDQRWMNGEGIALRSIALRFENSFAEKWKLPPTLSLNIWDFPSDK